MNKEEASKRLDAIEKEAKELRKIIETPEKPKRFKPKIRQKYYFVDSLNNVDYYEWDDDLFDNDCYNAFNCYETKEEAEREAEYFLTLRELRQFSDGLDGDWVVLYSRSEYITALWAFGSSKTLAIRFATKERAQQAIEHFGDRLDILYK